mmetsp:Transcript_48643/g.97447  ORF Transcript_48643/g.97447 Transcript_48643/m.97447 type:complete len:381 (+) Transcript_48643:571-1713(+)
MDSAVAHGLRYHAAATRQLIAGRSPAGLTEGEGAKTMLTKSSAEVVWLPSDPPGSLPPPSSLLPPTPLRFNAACIVSLRQRSCMRAFFLVWRDVSQAISVESNRKYRPDVHADPSEFLNWFLNSLHRGLGGSKGPTIISKVFQGKVRVESRKAKITKAGDKADGAEESWDEDVKPFLHLTLDLPPTPLYADSSERNIIPQVPLLTILHKFDGVQEQNLRGVLKRFRLKALPPYVIMTIKRFSMNTQFQVEKNPTIVSFPVKGLDLREFLDPEDVAPDAVTRYDLVANICHEGLVTKATGTNEVHDKGIAIKEGVFRAQVLNKSQEQWFQIDDLHIQEILPQVVSISEAYIQIYERSDLTAKRAELKQRSGMAVKEESMDA